MSVSWRRLNPPIPAMLATTLSLPCSSTMFLMAVATAASLVTSSWTGVKMPPAAVISSPVFSAASPLMSIPMTVPPSAAYRVAVALPTPDPAPVTAMTLSANRPIAAPRFVGAGQLRNRKPLEAGRWPIVMPFPRWSRRRSVKLKRVLVLAATRFKKGIHQGSLDNRKSNEIL